jgi:hypothetical protein
MLGAVEWMRFQSISQSGRQLAESRLGSKRYGGKTAKEFFAYCYGLRSALVHGRDPFPEWSEVSSASAQLETFVSDLLTGPYLGRADVAVGIGQK